MLSSRVQYELYNWQFKNAKYEMNCEIVLGKPVFTDDEFYLVCALSDTFGNWERSDSALGLIVGAAVRSLLSLIDDLEDGSLQREIEDV